ncbi:hypothetical protein K503DRAFT_855256 [Rhizopogon vinicolor AM-OR11-026]|uniref:Uncharacterized protein n=1 Tax=Rhizopogon vinicolor AM-OR11-026 TaxID=1314800 RepID=A0A1B7N6U1_9AGAM|nr:hypothetical protein K503DRAFT_855256 [Rhizopogon vinicolor AM-OR11-026]
MFRVRSTGHADPLSQQPQLMALPETPRTRFRGDLNDPVAKARKGFLSRLIVRPPQVSAKTVVRRPSTPEVRSHTPREPPERNLLREQPAPLILTQDPPQSEASVNVAIPLCKSIKDNLQELGLTTPVVLTQPQVTGSETPLLRVDTTVSPQNMLFNRVRLESRKTSHTSSSQSRPGSSPRGKVHMTSNYAINSEQPVWDSRCSDGRFAPLTTSTSNCPGSSPCPPSRMAVVEKFEEVPSSTTPNTVPSSIQNDSTPFSKVPPITSSTSTPSPSAHSMHSHTPLSNCSKRRQKSPSVDSGRVSVASRRSQRQVPAEPVSLFPVDEGLFGRPKPPPPLKIIPKKTKTHQRKETAPASLLPSTGSHERPPTRTSHTRSQTMHQTLVRRTPPSEPEGYFRVPDGSIYSDSATPPSLLPDSAPEVIHIRAPKGHSLSRTSTYTSVTSDETQVSATSAPDLPKNTKWTWTPPASWSGPSSAASTEGGDSAPNTKKPVFSTMAHLRRAKSSPRLVVSAFKFLYSLPDTSSATPAHSVTTKLGDKDPAQDKRSSHGVIIKIQGFHGDDLREAPLHDVIPRLRKLKSSAL